MSQRIASLYAEIGAKTDDFEKASRGVKKELTAQEKALQEWSKQATIQAKSFASVERQKQRELAKTAREAEKAARDTARAQKQSYQDMIGAAKSLSVGILAVGAALKGTYDIAKQGAALEFTREKFDRLAQSIGTTGDVLAGKMKEATKGTLSNFEAMAAATDLISLGLANTQEEAIRLATVQSGLAMDTNQLVLALTNQTTMRFDQLGVRVEGFQEKVDALKASGLDASAAFKEAFLQQAEEQLLRVGNAADSSYGSFLKLEAIIKNTGDSIKISIADSFAPMIEQLVRTREQSDAFTEYAKRASMSRQELVALGHSQERLSVIMEKGTAMTRFYSLQVRETASVVKTEAVPSLEKLSKVNADIVNLSIELTDNQRKFADGQEKTREEIEEYQAKLAELFPWETGERDKILEQIGELENKYEDDATAFEVNSRRKIAMMTIEKIAMLDGVAGYSQAEMERANAVLDTLGVVESSAARETLAIEAVTTALAEGKLKAEELDGALKMMENGYSIEAVIKLIGQTNYQINTPKTGTNKVLPSSYAEGTQGWKTVPPGFMNDSYPIWLTSGERFSVIPTGQGAAPTSTAATGGDMNTFIPILERLTSEFARAIRSEFQKAGRR